jgi:hypothetical protein
MKLKKLSLKNLFKFIYEKTHRVKYMKVQTSDLSDEFRYVPQWWFIWWHCSWHEIGYQYEVPYSYEDEADAWGSYYNCCVAFNFISYEEAQTKLDYYRMNDLKRQKKKEIKDAVLGYEGN